RIAVHDFKARRGGARSERFAATRRHHGAVAAARELSGELQHLPLATAPSALRVQVHHARGIHECAAHAPPRRGGGLACPAGPAPPVRYLGSLYILNCRYTLGTTRPDAMSATRVVSSSARSSRCCSSTSTRCRHCSRNSAPASCRSACSRMW